MNKKQSNAFRYSQYAGGLIFIIFGSSYLLGYDQLLNFSQTTTSICGAIGIVYGLSMIVQASKTNSKS